MSPSRPPRPVTPLSILEQQLQELVQLSEQQLGKASSLFLGLKNAHQLLAGLDPYLSRCSTPASPALRALEERTRAHDWSVAAGGLEQEMLSGHLEGQLLQILVHAVRARRVLEIGMFTGYSALAMAQALPPDGRVVACEVNEAVVAFAVESFAQTVDGAKIEVRVGPAEPSLIDLASSGEVFDLVFIDADKAGYQAYLDLVLTGDLLAPHGLVCVDNTLMQGQPWHGEQVTDNGRAITDFNDALRSDARIQQVLLPLRDGLTLIRRAPQNSPQ